MSEKKLDKVGATILAAFIMMSGTHVYCRYDVGTMVDKLFKKVSAETVAVAPLTQGPIAAAPVGAPADFAIDVADTEEQQPTITRNPFLVPAGARPAAERPQGMTPPTGGASGSAMAGRTVSAPVQDARPVVKGIVSSGSEKVAIIEYRGSSSTYRAGQSISGDYSVDDISSSGVSINGHSVPLGGRG